MILQRMFATTGEALKKKVSKLKEQHDWTDKQAKEHIAYRDSLAKELSEKRRKINSKDYKKGLKELDDFILGSSDKLSTMERNIDISDAMGSARVKSANNVADIARKASDIQIQHAKRAMNRSNGQVVKDYLYASKKKLPGALKKHKKAVIGTTVLATGTYAGKKAYDHYKNKKD